ncbi:unnamed protein product [Bursaphelenchus xylophilus]|uniref:(pine wood nematode) hypothetical protein n=1 Tax=Bursaphelenchus xylophilus TaxID=6326 RepID=A0A1I7RRF1_BURXY|nr:unnamed protein product [Bursaphelenchus xylophilus]CAG9130992.1 unnamed protein product [Bursaphelenchus xylophilus]
MKKNDPEWTCFCGITVHNAMFVVSFVGIVISVASIIVAVMTENWSEVILSVVSLVTYFLVLLARMLHKPWLYLPLIVLHTATQVFGVLLAVLKLLLFFKLIKKKDFAWVDLLWFNLDPTLLTAIFCAFAVIDALLQIYFVSLAWRAYQFMKTFIINECKTTVATIHKIQNYKRKK